MKRQWVQLRNPQRDQYTFQLRLIVGMGLVLVLVLVLLAQLFYLQVIRHEYFSALSQNNHVSLVPVTPNRGQILDRHGSVLASNYSSYTLEIEPGQTDNLDATIRDLSTLVNITAKDRRLFKKLLAENHDFVSLPIHSRLSDDEVARFAAQQYRFPGVSLKAHLFREYPLHENSSHLIGYIGRINEQDLKDLKQSGKHDNYRGTDYIGKSGIEQSYEDRLHGKTGFEQIEVDASGRGVRLLSRTPPVPGDDLILTLDAKLQEVAEQAFGAYRGALVAIDPNNGEILAYISKPGYDPNLFIDGIDSDTWDDLSNSPDVPLNNRILRGQYPPGSTIKPFMALAGLHYNVRTPDQTIFDPGYFTLAGNSHRYRDWLKTGHGTVNLFRSIVVSCDTYYYRLAVDLGINRMHDFLSKFGFGAKTGIDIAGELSGLLPTEEWKRARYNDKWYGGDTVSAGIGQGYMLVTPMQQAFAIATLANNGVAYRPHLLRQLQRNGKLLDTVAIPQPIYDLHLDPDAVALVKKAMNAVTKPGGTAAFAGSGTPYEFAGKTGTAQVIAIKQDGRYVASQVEERKRDHAWFIAFAPLDAPKIALAVLVENGGHGGTTAAPIARKVFDYYLLHKTPTPLAPQRDTGAQDD
jgi:penicillin-binding protein 2